jgi:hypothetical protein
MLQLRNLALWKSIHADLAEGQFADQEHTQVRLYMLFQKELYNGIPNAAVLRVTWNTIVKLF